MLCHSQEDHHEKCSERHQGSGGCVSGPDVGEATAFRGQGSHPLSAGARMKCHDYINDAKALTTIENKLTSKI